MNSLANKAVSAAYNKLGRVNDLLNGPDPRFVSYRENGKDKKIEHLNLDSAHCRSFIGKMKLDGEGTYSDKVITVLLKYFLDHTKKGEKVGIELANKVSELLNGEGAMDGHMDFETQKKYILDLAKDLDKKRVNDVEIIDIQDNNRRLFEVLGKAGLQGLEGLQANGLNLNLGEKFDSLDIAKILYYIARNDPNYFDAIKDLKRGELKQMSGAVDYYGLIEISIRINALLHGVTTQGGIALQKDYDALLLKHINPYVKDFPLLSDFQTACREKLKGESFNGLYFDTDKSKEMFHKIDQKDKIKSKARNALLIILTAGALFSGGKFVEHTIQEKKQKDAIEAIIQDILKTKKLTWAGDMGYGVYEGKDKTEWINKYINSIYDRFLLRYGTTGELSETAFKAKIADRINDQKILDMLGSSGCGSDSSPVEDIIIDDYVVAKDKGEFSTLGINTVPYSQYLKYTDAFVNTILLDEYFESTWNETKGDIGRFSYMTRATKDIGAYSPKYQGVYYASTVYVYELATITKNGKEYMIATTDISDKKFKKLDNSILSSSQGKELAIDFIRQTYPVVNEMLDQYLVRYYRAYGNSFTVDQNGAIIVGKEKLRTDLIELLVKDFLRKGLLTKIHQTDTKKIMNYLDRFVIEHNQALKDLDLEVNKDLLPNGSLSSYEQVINNTLNDNYPEKEMRKSQYITPSRAPGEKDYILEEIISKYTASDAKTYFLGLTEIGGKKYLCAREEFPTDYYGGRYYSIGMGEVVARDYFKTKAKFMEQKILREKQQKSALQTHVDKPRDLLKNDGSQGKFKSPYIPFKK